MKKIILVFVGIVLLLSSASAEQLVFSTETADALIASSSTKFVGIVVSPDGTNDVTFDFYDNTAASGTKFLPSMTFAGDGEAKAVFLPKSMPTNNGIYINITLGAGSVEYTVITEE